MFVSLGDNQIEVVVIRKNNKNIYFRFKDDLKLYITCNIFVTKKEILKLINENNDALLKMYNKQLSLNNANSYFNYLGNKYIKVEDPSIKTI